MLVLKNLYDKESILLFLQKHSVFLSLIIVVSEKGREWKVMKDV